MAALKSIYRAGCQSEWGILSRQSPGQEATARYRPIPKIQGFGVVFQQDGALAYRARDTVALLEQKVPDFVSLTMWSPNSPEQNPDDHSIWCVGLMQGKVYRSRIANVNELEMRLIDESGRFDQSISWMLLSRPVAPSSQRLCSWSGAHFEHQA